MTTHANNPRHVPVNVAGGWKPNQSSESSYAMQAQAGELHDIYGKSREAKFSAKDAGWLKENQGAYLYSGVSVKDRESWSAEKALRVLPPKTFLSLGRTTTLHPIQTR